MLGFGSFYRLLSFQVTVPVTDTVPRKNLVPVQGKDAIKGKCWGPGDVVGGREGVSLQDELSGQSPFV